MRRNTSDLLLALALLAVAFARPAAAAPADPAAWLLKASVSSRQQSYEGVVVYRGEESMETLRIVHRYKDGREQERLTALSGAPRDVLREGDRVSCMLPHAHPVETAEGPQTLLPVLSPDILRQAAPHYRLRDLGEARVAGRISRGVAIEPRDEYRYGYEVWADRQTAVALKVSLMDRKGRAIEEMLYTEVQFPANIADREFEMPPGKRRAVPITPAAAATPVAQSPAASSTAWVSKQMPPGFAIAMRSLRPSLPGEGAVEHVLLSDGLSAVSVFSTRMTQHDKLFRGFSHMGAMHAYGRMVGDYHVTVVGEVPQATVRMIGDGLTPAQ